MSELPTGWMLSPIGELGIWRGGGTPSKANSAFWKDGDIPWVSPKDMKRFFINSAEDQITAAAVAGSATQLIPKGSMLLVTRSGILQHTLPVAVNTREVAINQDLKALSPNPSIDPVFIGLQVRSLAEEILATCAKSGTTVDSIDFERLKTFSVRVPPLPEQRRIVTKIDSLSSKSGRARASLDHIPRLVEKYKQAILAVAFRGGLTAEKTERKTLGNICPIKAGFAFKSSDFRSAGDVPVLRIGDISDGEVTFTDSSRYLDKSFLSAAADFRVKRGDILVALSGATTGKSGVYKLEQPALLNQRVARLRPDEPFSPDAHLIAYFVRWISAEILGASYGGAQPNISPQKLAAFELEWPFAKGRVEIVGKLRGAFAWIERLASETTSARKLIDHLDQSILAKAFRGELVPQDPNDEPASVLRERIRAERATGSENGRRRGRRCATG